MPNAVHVIFRQSPAVGCHATAPRKWQNGRRWSSCPCHATDPLPPPTGACAASPEKIGTYFSGARVHIGNFCL